MTDVITDNVEILVDVDPVGAPGPALHSALQGLGSDDHPHYLNQARGDVRYSTKTETADALAAHAGAADPHAQYLDAARGDARYYSRAQTDQRIGDIVGAAPAALDTLKEVADQLAADQGAASALAVTVANQGAQIAGKENSGVAAGLIAAAIGVSVQAYNATLSALAGVATTVFGRSLMELPSAAALRTAIALPTVTAAGRLARYTDAAGAQSQTLGIYEDIYGQIGIFTTAPEGSLHIKSAGVPVAIVQSTGGTNRAELRLRNTVQQWYMSVQPTTGNFVLSAPIGAADQFCIAGSGAGAGNAGFGTLSPTAKIDNGGDTYRQRVARTPASATAAGNAGDWCWDTDYFYICVATNMWHRSAHATW